MKTIKFTLILLFIAVTSQAQGIKFESGLSWLQIKEKAKAEHKLIFVDCYATWCGPCKQMDKEVFPSKKAGDYFNKQFISVKVQMDRSTGDVKAVKDWYAMADTLKKRCEIEGYPTFLFFTAEGKLLHKGTGYRSTGGLIMMASDLLGTMGLEERKTEETTQFGKVASVSLATAKLLKDAFGEKGKLDYGSDTSWMAKAKVIDDKYRQNPPKPGDGIEDDPWKLNIAAWNMFEYCNDDAVLKRALVWSEVSIELDKMNYNEKKTKEQLVGINVQLLDTRANLLYKLGRKAEAIAQEEQAITLDNEMAKKAGKEKGFFVEEYEKIVAKMKAGQSTWPE